MSRFYASVAAAHGTDVLELGCGTGRLLVAMARAGATVTGVDVSEPMLERARRRVAAEPPAIRSRVTSLIHADVRRARFADANYSLVVAPFRLLQFITTVPEQVSLLMRVHHLLRPGGRFAFDLFDFSLFDRPVVGEEFGDEPEFVLPDGTRVVRRKTVVDWDPPAQTLTTRSTFYFVGQRQQPVVQQHTVRYFFRYELEHLLGRTGFCIDRLDCDFAGTPYGHTYPAEIVVLAHAV
jgi:ubiquinone/menaquinone biosynthesis C-methylase UbiE